MEVECAVITESSKIISQMSPNCGTTILNINIPMEFNMKKH